MRKLADIKDAENKYYEILWYERHKVLVARGLIDKYLNSGESDKVEIAKKAIAKAKQVEEKYKDEYDFNKNGYNDFDFGMINGKLSALRWVLGEEWDSLDT